MCRSTSIRTEPTSRVTGARSGSTPRRSTARIRATSSRGEGFLVLFGCGRAVRDALRHSGLARQGQREGRALSFDGPHPYLPAVRGGDVLDDGESQPGAAGGAVPRRVDAVEALEDAVE